MTPKVWIDGGIVDASEALIPVMDHGLLYGDGIFEGLRVVGRRVFRLEDHLARLRAGARAIGLEIPGGLGAMREIVLETARAYDRDDAYLRLIVTRGEGALGVDPTTCPEPRVLCIVDRLRIYGAAELARGIDLVTASGRRLPAARQESQLSHQCARQARGASPRRRRGAAPQYCRCGRRGQCRQRIRLSRRGASDAAPHRRRSRGHHAGHRARAGGDPRHSRW